MTHYVYQLRFACGHTKAIKTRAELKPLTIQKTQSGLCPRCNRRKVKVVVDHQEEGV